MPIILVPRKQRQLDLTLSGQPQIHSKCEAIVGSMRICLKRGEKVNFNVIFYVA